MAAITWFGYLVFAFVIMPAAFRVRFSRWPFVSPLQLGKPYNLMEILYGALLLVFTTALLADAPKPAAYAGVGVVSMIMGMALQGWSVRALGRCWRIGQDRSDTTCTFVRRGPYRLFAHPIYVSMGVISFGQMLVMGRDWRSVTLLVGNFLYGLVQGRAESQRWRDTGASVS